MDRPRSQPPAPRSLEADMACVRGSWSAPRRARRLPSRLHGCSWALLSDLLRLNLGGRRPAWSSAARAAGTEPRSVRECARGARGSADGHGARGSSREFAASDSGEGRLSPPRTRAGADKAMRCSGYHAALPRTPGRVGDAAKLPSPSSPFPCPQTTAPGGPRWSHP